jgi:hypothetical protein
MFSEDWSQYGTLSYLQREYDIDLSKGPGWYETAYKNKSGKKCTDCMLLVEIPKGSDPKQHYTLYCWNFRSITEVKRLLSDIVTMPEHR